MGYEILSDDLLHNKDEANGPPRSSWLRKFIDRVKWFKLHLFTVLIIILGIFLYFNLDLDFNFEDTESGVLTLSGNFKSFSQNYTGDLEVDSTKFSILSPSGQFDGETQTILLKNFSGTINQINKSIIFNGTTQTLEFGKNKLNTQDKTFILTSTGKTNTKLLLKEIFFEELNGAAKLDKTLNYEFENSSIKIFNFNTSFAYDGTFTFSGQAEKFEIISNKHNLKINFDKNSTKPNSEETSE